MLEGYEKMRLLDEAGKNHLVVEVNWDEEDLKSNECKIVRFTCSCGKKSHVKREYLNSYLFLIGDPQAQAKLIPQTLQPVHVKAIKLGITATKDIRKGEKINLPPIEVQVPCHITKQVIGRDLGKRSTNNAIVKPV